MDARELDLEGKTPEEIIALAKDEGYELSDAELEQISGGGWDSGSSSPSTCPKCKGHNVTTEHQPATHLLEHVCEDCGARW